VEAASLILLITFAVEQPAALLALAALVGLTAVVRPRADSA